MGWTLTVTLWIVLGGLVGWLATKVLRGGALGTLGSVLMGVVGGVLAGFTVGLLGAPGVSGFDIWSVIASVFGAMALLLVIRLLFGATRRTV